MANKLKLYLIISILIVSSISLKCGEEEIEHCLQCETGENINSYTLCEDKYFPIMSNIVCLPCNDPLYGNYGCKGKCSIAGNNYQESRNILCEEGACIEGYYQLEGICTPCSIGSPNCAKCTYGPIQSKVPEGEDEEVNPDNTNHFICNECINNQYKINNEGRCQQCYLQHCSQCHYNSNGEDICDRCYYGYYVNSGGTCSECYTGYINNGQCNVCGEQINAETSNCYCYDHYTLSSPITCVICNENCKKCNYDNFSKKTSCFQCNDGYTLNSQGVCVSCGENCQFCYLDNNQNHICTSCFPGFELNENNNCLSCPENCRSCKKDSNGILKCTSCFDYYGINDKNECKSCPAHCINCFWKSSIGEFGCSYCNKESYSYYINNYNFYKNNYIEDKDDKCVLCTSIDEIGGEGCILCSYDKYGDKNYKCHSCLGEYHTSSFRNYAYIYNQYQCLENSQNAPKNLYGCLYATYDNINEVYKCHSCKEDFIYIINENSCKVPSEINLSSYCIEAQNIGKDNPLYSCTYCR